MGYVATSMSIPSVKKAICEAGTGLYIAQYVTDGGGAYDTIFDSTVNLTDIDELTITFVNDAATDVKCSIGGVLKFTESGSGAVINIIDTSGNTGETSIKLEIQDAGATKNITDLTMWASNGA